MTEIFLSGTFEEVKKEHDKLHDLEAYVKQINMDYMRKSKMDEKARKHSRELT